MIGAEEYLAPHELGSLGLGGCGRNVFISRRAVIANPAKLFLGSHIRIDAYCSIIGREPVRLGDNCHVGSSVSISASAPVQIGSYSGIASGARLFTADDDYSGSYLTGPTVPPESTGVKTAAIEIGSFCVVGANAVLLPGTIMEEGAVVGALSLANGRFEGWAIYGGVPAKRLKERTKGALRLVEQLGN
ncbi:MAG TPA: DapH/DapD/GlmU-related protein [Allosphingosinicella sp.]